MKLLALLPVLLLALSACRGGEPTLFELLPSSQTGITFANTLVEDDSLFNPVDFDYIYNGAGVAVGDFNGNGLQDVFFGGNMVSSRLYLNQGEFRFEDVTEAAGVGTDVWVTGVTVVDINQDGWLDIYLSVAGKVEEAKRANLLFVNQGPDENGVPRFVEQAAAYGIADTGYSTHAVFFDYDGDGDLDLYILTNALENFSRNQLRGIRRDGEAESTDRLYRNNGDGTFTNVSREAGILIEGYGLGVAVADLNQDGWPDIYVANDFQTNDLIWVNNGDGTFTNRAADYLRVQTHNAMGVDIADINDDGLPEILVADMLPRDNYRKKMMLGGSNYDVFQMALTMGYQPQYVRNTLQLHNGFGPAGVPNFSEIGQLAGVHDTDWSWAPLFSDFDNSGRRDLYITNGYRRDVTNLDFIVFNQEAVATNLDAKARRAAVLRAMRELPEVKLPNYIFRNNGDLTFADATEAWGMDIPSFSTGAVFVDLDNDGALDLVVSNLDGEAFVFRNRAREQHPDRNFLRVDLAGPAGNRGGFGAKVTIHAGGTRQFHDHTPYRGYKSTVEQTIHFGLGTAAGVDSLEVRWPDGSYQMLTGIAPNQVLTVRHADAGPYVARPAAEAPRLFEPADIPGLAWAHSSARLADFKHTPLLPHKHSQNGPGIAVGDVTGNGLDDVYVGTGRGEAKAVLLQTAPGRFERRPIPDAGDFEDMGALFFDADGDGHLDLYVVSGGGFLSHLPAHFADRLYLNDGRGNFRRAPDALPDVTASGSCVVAADFTGDGRLDLFVCGRVVPGEYPTAPRSYLLRNDSRPGAPRFTDVTEELAPGLARVGMVTSALWTDFDGDGRVDLLLAGEWMPITFFRNQGGRLADATGATGLGRTEGWWNSMVAGDFTGDGRTDYILGNLGRNTEYKVSEREPMRLFAADFDGNGSIDPVHFYYIQGRSHPAHSRDQMIDQMVSMKGRFRRFTDFATASLDQTLSPQEREKASLHESVVFESVLLENQGGGRFALRPLPVRAQFAPKFGMLARDFDGDGNLDVLMVGNSHATDTRTGWYTASTGTLLLGDGRGGFRPVESRSSGFFVDGDAKGVAQLVLPDGRSLVLVTQNNDSLRAFVTAGAEGARQVRLQPTDASALLTWADGRQRREEFHHGSTYLSQWSRVLTVPAGVARVEVIDFAGRAREVR